jgi:hypothetical protein
MVKLSAIVVAAALGSCAAFTFNSPSAFSALSKPNKLQLSATVASPYDLGEIIVDHEKEWTPFSRPDSEYLIGEEMITNDDEASALADRCIAEAVRLFDSPSEGWKTEFTSDDGVVVESKPLHGPYEPSGVLIVRGVGTIPASADKFYDFQVSREGFQSIDEYLVNHRMVDEYTWKTAEDRGYTKDDYQLMMNRVEWKYPFKRREFVALDTVDRKNKILISKSALHKKRSGGSRYQTAVKKDEWQFIRAVQYYASRVTPIDDNSCKLEMVTWGEMCDNYSAFWVNMFNAHVFITPKFDRFKRVMEGETVFEESKIIDNAWQLLKMFKDLKPDVKGSKQSDFVKDKTAK